MNNEITIFCPATVANVSCGYDVLGFCLDGIGDIMTVSKTQNKGIEIIHRDNFGLETEPNKNVAGISALALLDKVDLDFGFKIEIDKKIKPGSGIGSSAASATGSVYAINELLGRPFNKIQLTEFAMAGESFASNCEHADNLAPAIFGGFTLVKSVSPLKIIELPTPKDLFATILHPQIEINTSDAKGILPKEVSMNKAIRQWANVGSLVHALHVNDYNLIRESLVDEIIEPHRAELIPKFQDVKKSSIQNGALGCGISGSGPSIFALSKGRDKAITVEKGMHKIYDSAKIKFNTYVSDINKVGIKRVTDDVN